MWKDLSMKEKSAMMKVAIANGITNLNEIQNSYNEFAEGGPTNNIKTTTNYTFDKNKYKVYMDNAGKKYITVGGNKYYRQPNGRWGTLELNNYLNSLSDTQLSKMGITKNVSSEKAINRDTRSEEFTVPLTEHKKDSKQYYNNNIFSWDNLWKSGVQAGDIVSEHFDNISRIPTIIYNAIFNRLNLLGDGQIYDLDNPIRVGSDTKNVKNILFNDFVENNSNNIRQAKDFINTTDTLIGDRKIPLNKISLYYGIENGKFKVDSIQNFNPNTIVVPNRYKNKGKIMKLLPPDENTKIEINKKYVEELEYKNNIIANEIVPKYFSELFKDLKSRGFKDAGNVAIALLNGEFYRKTLKSEYLQSYKKLQEALSKTDYNENNKKLHFEYSKEIVPTTRAITENNDTISLKEYGWKPSQSPKIVFGTPNRGGFMIYGNIDSIISKVNNKLKSLNGAYPVLVDNGRYSGIETVAPKYSTYTAGDWQRNPNSMFVIGNKKKKGGYLTIHENT